MGIDLAHRDWIVTAMSAPTLGKHLRANAVATTGLLGNAGAYVHMERAII